jgi:hypothetical protein
MSEEHRLIRNERETGRSVRCGMDDTKWGTSAAEVDSMWLAIACILSEARAAVLVMRLRRKVMVSAAANDR